MNNITSIITILRSIIKDELITGTDIFVYTTSPIFTLTEKNAIAITDVMVNDVASGVTYTEDLTKARLSVTSSLSVDDVVQVDYTYYSNYSDNELTAYIKSAIAQLAIHNINTFKLDGVTMYPEPSDSESYLIAMIAGTLINPQNVTYRLPDVSVVVPTNSMSTQDKINQLISIYKKDSSGIMFIAEDKNSRDIFGNTNGLGIFRQF